MTYCVGLTGGIGSGKSAVADAFRALGVDVFSADDMAREVVQAGSPALTKIAEHFGPQVLDQRGNLNRPVLREIIFSQPSEKAWLEQLTHPLIADLRQQKIAAASSAYVVLEIPLLFETGLETSVDRILVVDVPSQQQLERACSRDSSSSAQIQRIMDQQVTRARRIAGAHDLIDNSGSLADIPPQVEELDRLYRTLASQTPASHGTN